MHRYTSSSRCWRACCVALMTAVAVLAFHESLRAEIRYFERGHFTMDLPSGWDVEWEAIPFGFLDEGATTEPLARLRKRSETRGVWTCRVTRYYDRNITSSESFVSQVARKIGADWARQTVKQELVAGTSAATLSGTALSGKKPRYLKLLAFEYQHAHWLLEVMAPADAADAGQADFSRLIQSFAFAPATGPPKRAVSFVHDDRDRVEVMVPAGFRRVEPHGDHVRIRAVRPSSNSSEPATSITVSARSLRSHYDGELYMQHVIRDLGALGFALKRPTPFELPDGVVGSITSGSGTGKVRDKEPRVAIALFGRENRVYSITVFDQGKDSPDSALVILQRLRRELSVKALTPDLAREIPGLVSVEATCRAANLSGTPGGPKQGLHIGLVFRDADGEALLFAGLPYRVRVSLSTRKGETVLHDIRYGASSTDFHPGSVHHWDSRIYLRRLPGKHSISTFEGELRITVELRGRKFVAPPVTIRP